jgi:hypothetical protein
MTNTTYRIAKPATGTNGKISAFSMVSALVTSGVPLASIKLVEQLSAEELNRVRELAA